MKIFDSIGKVFINQISCVNKQVYVFCNRSNVVWIGTIVVKSLYKSLFVKCTYEILLFNIAESEIKQHKHTA